MFCSISNLQAGCSSLFQDHILNQNTKRTLINWVRLTGIQGQKEERVREERRRERGEGGVEGKRKGGKERGRKRERVEFGVDF